MPEGAIPESNIEPVRGRLDESVAASLREFWQRQGVLDDGQARARLPRVLTRMVDAEGHTVGSNSATPARIPAIANQWMLVYRGLISEEFLSPERWMAMLSAAWDVLIDEREQGIDVHCVGVLVPLADESIEQAWPQLVWPETEFFHAGRAQNGAALRVRYFEDARIIAEGPA